MSTFQVLNFGCRASQADGAALKRQLLDAGLAEVSNGEESQVAVLNTCTVTATADAEVRQIIRRIHRSNPDCRILVTGCYAQRAPEEIAGLPGVTWVVGNSHKHGIAKLLAGPQEPEAGSQKSEEGIQNSEFRILKPVPRAAVLVGEITEDFHFAPVFPDDHTRPTLKVQDGCNARCSFCIIPEVRGPSRSLPPEQVIAQVCALEQQGYKEIVLSGINLGSYGKDLERRITFLGLLEQILAQTGIARIRISSIEPMDVSPALIRLVASEPRMAQHFHVPLQSGCDRTLRAMNRRYWANHYAERIQAIREQIPNAGIGADVMVGFPGETVDDHEISLRSIDSLPFTYLHVFPYSSRPGTPAAASRHHLNGRVIHERGKEMRAVGAKKRQAFLEAQIGGTLSAVTLGEEAAGARVALSTNYVRVALPASDVAANTMVEVRVGRANHAMVYGYPEAGIASRPPQC